MLLDGKQTDEKFTAFLNISSPGGGPGPHYHEREACSIKTSVSSTALNGWRLISPTIFGKRNKASPD